jgi:hypothetical protein
VLGELGQVRLGIGRVQRLEGLGDRAVQANPPRGREVLVQRVAHQDVRETQAPARLGHRPHEPGGGRFVESVEQVVLLQPADAGDHVGIELTADHGGEGEHLTAPIGLPLQAAPDHFHDSLGDREPARRGLAPGGEQAADLLGEEGIAVGLGVDLGGEVVGGRIAHREGQEA